jgi:hypothetical protein
MRALPESVLDAITGGNGPVPTEPPWFLRRNFNPEAFDRKVGRQMWALTAGELVTGLASAVGGVWAGSRVLNHFDGEGK